MEMRTPYALTPSRHTIANFSRPIPQQESSAEFYKLQTASSNTFLKLIDTELPVVGYTLF